ncbi:hypothetical protein DSL72_007639 [Monilinia vaccinii-corymbosi]|uniref:Uncharacterized protein n=1 Tax=Monilinia vaccinii-corymbosi TaxID=61207 RepID=A0A8A3PIG9_9HELO|nr:hypothetical protein DSL72_007639 [Monilinia vaccinii-corymbosi]
MASENQVNETDEYDGLTIYTAMTPASTITATPTCDPMTPFNNNGAADASSSGPSSSLPPATITEASTGDAPKPKAGCTSKTPHQDATSDTISTAASSALRRNDGDGSAFPHGPDPTGAIIS